MFSGIGNAFSDTSTYPTVSEAFPDEADSSSLKAKMPTQTKSKSPLDNPAIAKLYNEVKNLQAQIKQLPDKQNSAETKSKLKAKIRSNMAQAMSLFRASLREDNINQGQINDSTSINSKTNSPLDEKLDTYSKPTPKKQDTISGKKISALDSKESKHLQTSVNNKKETTVTSDNENFTKNLEVKSQVNENKIDKDKLPSTGENVSKIWIIIAGFVLVIGLALVFSKRSK